MNARFSEQRSAAIRAGLVAEAARQQRQRPHGWRAVGLLMVGVLAGAGAASAAFAAGGGAPVPHPAATSTTTSSGAFIPAPPGVVPGTPVISLLGAAKSLLVEHRATLDVSKRPEGATHVRVAVTCLTAGTTTFGTDAGGNNPSIECEAVDPEAAYNVAWQDFELGKSVDKLYFTASDGATASVSVQFINRVPTRLGVNARGQTYGVLDAPEGHPDLVWTAGRDSNGQDVSGYCLRADLDAFSPDHPGQPTSPAEAVRLQEERDRKYPNGWDIPLYESDGETQIGTFHRG